MLKIYCSIIFVVLFLCVDAQVKRHVYYKYDLAKSPLDNYKYGYADTFSLYGNKFRVRLIDTSYNADEPMALEKFDKRWLVVDNFNNSRHYSYSKDSGIDPDSSDINFDGFKDFVVEERWFHLVFLYNPAKRTFIKSGYYQCDPLPQKIDGESMLYFDRWGFKFNNYWSYLYTIKDYQRINLGIIELKVASSNVSEGEYKPSYISIRKINENGEKEIERIKSNISAFNIQNYWQAHIKQFYSKELVVKRKPDLSWPELFNALGK